jgi:hypothetical protein
VEAEVLRKLGCVNRAVPIYTDASCCGSQKVRVSIIMSSKIS